MAEKPPTPEEILARLEKLFANRRRMSLYGKGIFPTKYQGQNSDVFVTGKDHNPVDSDGKPVTYQGKNILNAFAVTKFKGSDEAILLRIANSEKFAAFCDDESSGEGEGLSKRDIERSGKRKEGKKNVTGQIAYCYSALIKRRESTSQSYQWFWQVWIGGWQAENILVKEWGISESLALQNLFLQRPLAIVDLRKNTFYVSLCYFFWDGNTLQQRYALIKGTKKEDMQTQWDKSVNEMISLPNPLYLVPRGFGYWSSNATRNSSTATGSFFEIWDGAVSSYIDPSFSPIVPMGWRYPPVTGVYFPTNLSSLYRLSEDGEKLLTQKIEPISDSQSYKVLLQQRQVYTSNSSLETDMPVGGSLPFMVKNAKIGNRIDRALPPPSFDTGDVSRFLTSLLPADNDIINDRDSLGGAGSPCFTDVHDKFISAIQRPDLLNRDTTETQNIYGDLSPVITSPDPSKLPGLLTLSDIFPELQATPPAPGWIGYKNIEHENRTVEVFLWNHGLTASYAQGSLKVEVQKMDAIAKIIAANDTLQSLLYYNFLNASFG